MEAQTLSITVTSPAQQVAVLAALQMTKEVEDIGRNAGSGRILDQCEEAVVTRGREFVRSVLENVVAHEAAEAEKKGRRPECAPAAAPATSAPGIRAES